MAQPGLRYDYTQRDPLAGVAPDNWLTPAERLNRKRFYTAAGVGTAAYLGFGAGLYSIWYKDYELTGLRSFDECLNRQLCGKHWC